MSLSIIKYPDRQVNNDPLTLSKWSAVHHAILFQLKRIDYSTLMAYNSSTEVLTAYLFGTLIDTFNIGDDVYIESPNGSAVFKVATFSAPNIITFEPQFYTGPLDTSGILNAITARPNYFTKTNIWKVNASNQYELVSTSLNAPSVKGIVDVDVSSFLKSLVGYEETFDYNSLNSKDETLGERFNINFSENWIGFEGPVSGISSTDLRYFVNAAKQIGDIYGNNMGEYVPFLGQAAETPKAKFLTDFETPTYFPGFPFALSFIYSEKLLGTKTSKIEEHFDNNGNSISTSSKKLDSAQAPAVNRLTIDADYVQEKFVEVWLDNDGTLDPILYVAPGYVATGYVAPQPNPPIVEQPPETNPPTL